MGEKIKILGVPFDCVDMNGAVNKAMEFISKGGFYMICTPNPEIVMAARENKEFLKLLCNADMVVADGVGVVWASKYYGYRLKERVSGYDLSIEIFKRLKNTDYRVYFLGGAEGVSSKALKKMESKYKGLKIVGAKNGYFNEETKEDILRDIEEKKPDFLLVGLGSPKQEKWIAANRKRLNCTCIGVGGSFDVMAGELKRAPKVFQSLGLEWFYRLVTQPTRFKRMLRLPKFVITVLLDRER